MPTIFVIIGILSGVGGVVVWSGSKSAIHEIEALVTFLIGWILIVGGAILGVLGDIRGLLSARLPK